jgi:hypothetical protein
LTLGSAEGRSVRYVWYTCSSSGSMLYLQMGGEVGG